MILGLLKGVPWYLWLVLAVVAWGGWQRHNANSAATRLRETEAAITKQRGEAMEKTIAETSRRLSEQKRISNETSSKLAKATASAAGAAAAAERLRAHLATVTAGAGSGDPAASKGSEAAAIAGVLGECAGRYQAMAAIADSAIVAGQACERAYDSLTQ